MATIGAQASYGIDMKYVLVAPIWAIPKCLKKEGIGIDDVDLFEVNEAFSGSTVSVMNELGLILPGTPTSTAEAVALGHPIGASGCRVLVTLLHEHDPPGEKDRTGFAVSGGWGGRGHGCQTLMLIPKRHLAAHICVLTIFKSSTQRCYASGLKIVAALI
jgi:acetyl-CoA acetyltransferase